jgi:hypothetical protein
VLLKRLSDWCFRHFHPTWQLRCSGDVPLHEAQVIVCNCGRRYVISPPHNLFCCLDHNPELVDALCHFYDKDREFFLGA